MPTDYPSWLNESLLVLSKGNSRALFNKKGEQLTDFVYTVISKSEEKGLCKVRIGDKYGFIDFNGKMVIPIDIDFCEDFKDGYAIIKQKDKWGAIDKKGKIVIEVKYEYKEAKIC